MPKLGKKEYPYTKAGMDQYKKDKAKKSMSKKKPMKKVK